MASTHAKGQGVSADTPAIDQVELFPELPGESASSSRKPDPTKLDAKRVAQMVPDKTADAFKTISEAAAILALPQYVLRFWETKFKQIKPLKMRGGRRYYRPEDIEVLQTIKHLLYKEGYTIKGAKKAFDELKKTNKAEKPSRRKRKKPAPLLQPQRPAPPAISEQKLARRAQKKQELAAIQQELLALREELV